MGLRRDVPRPAHQPPVRPPRHRRPPRHPPPAARTRPAHPDDRRAAPVGRPDPAVAFLHHDDEQVRQTAARLRDLDLQIAHVADTRRDLVDTEQEASDAYERTLAAIHEADTRRQELSGIRQLRRGVRDEIEQLHRQINDGRNRLHELHGQRARARRQLARLHDQTQMDAWKAERDDLGQRLARIVDQRTAPSCTSRPAT